MTTSHSLAASSSIKITLPNSFPITTGFANCGISGATLTSQAYCSYSSVTNSIEASNFNSSTANISPLVLTLNILLIMSQAVGNFAVIVVTKSEGNIVDSGSVSISVISRKLSSSQLSIASGSLTTYSPTTYTIVLSLPFDLGYTFTLTILIPVDVRLGLTPTISNATFVSYGSHTLTATGSAFSNTSLVINNLLTPISTQPITVNVNLYYSGALLFYGSQQLTMTSLKTFTTLTSIQSSQIVY